MLSLCSFFFELPNYGHYLGQGLSLSGLFAQSQVSEGHIHHINKEARGPLFVFMFAVFYSFSCSGQLTFVSGPDLARGPPFENPWPRLYNNEL